METTRLVSMSKKNKKQNIVEHSLELDANDVLSECASGLMIAMNYAIEHRDVEAMLAVSDRWFRMYVELNGSNEEEQQAYKLGFVKDEHEHQ